MAKSSFIVVTAAALTLGTVAAFAAAGPAGHSHEHFSAGEPGNPGDFLYRSLGEDDVREVELRLQRAPAGEAVMWIAERDLLVAA